ncbi:glutaredoxin domain-containing protein [Actinoplanes regularis]|uniref:glutaredoxin domain-containing protein n=1 Tax=Actinoplanes regularis TaxID=52697 RepID=UPI00249FB09B|nr:glutaredoxin domain-containing protein [Actinoplanes regularis]GLW32691.1 membrane protein [Actinoplanes regularis]
MARRWGLALLSVACGAIIAAIKFGQGAPGGAAVLLSIFVVLAILTSPLAFPRGVPAAEAVAGGRPIVYWRPGCPYCLRLRARLGPEASRLQWVDIWKDPEGAAVVRGFADGNETVPTVVFGGEGFVNPDPQWVRERLQTL